MNKHAVEKIVLSFLMVGALWLAGARPAPAQFTQNRETVKIDTSSYPPDVRKSYNVFSVKCGECHTLDKSLKPSLPAAQWTNIVKQMQAMASAHITDKDVQSILNFLNYDEEHRKAQAKSAIVPAAADSIAAGRELYSSQGCDTCHSIAGKGGDVGPALNGIGSKLSRDQLTQIVKNGKSGTAMPALPPGTTDQQVSQMIEYLMSLK